MLATLLVGSNLLSGARHGALCAGLVLIPVLLFTTANGGDVEAGRQGDFERTLRELRSAAEQGDARSQNRLGSIYASGRDVERDRGEAMRWYRRAAEQGLREAQLVLVRMLRESDQVTAQEVEESVKWTIELANAGSSPAQRVLGIWYLHGDGLPTDPEQAERWLRRAAEQGFPPAMYELGRLYFNGNGVAYDEAEGRRWLEAAAENGFEQAKLILGAKSRLRDYHLAHGRFLDWPAGRPLVVRTPEEIRRGPQAPVAFDGMDEIHCDFFPRRNHGGNPKFRCFMMTGPRSAGGSYYDVFGNVQPRATEVLGLMDGHELRPVLAADGKPMTYRTAFRSVSLPPLELKIKFRPYVRPNPKRDRDMHTEIAATRLLWALRYAADRMYPVPKVVCHRCPTDPFRSEAPWVAGSQTTFKEVAIELRYGGEEVVRSEQTFDGGWSWGDELWRLRYGRGVRGFSEEQKTRFDGLLVLMTLLGQSSGRPNQNRLVCRRESMQPLANWRFCSETVLLVHDLGAVFGKRQVESLNEWGSEPVWNDPATCELNLALRERRREQPWRMFVGRKGQKFILEALDQLTDEHLRAIFESAAFERYDLTLIEPGKRPTPEQGRQIIDAWVQEFRAKIEQIRDADCPEQ